MPTALEASLVSKTPALYLYIYEEHVNKQNMHVGNMWHWYGPTAEVWVKLILLQEKKDDKMDNFA